KHRVGGTHGPNPAPHGDQRRDDEIDARAVGQPVTYAVAARALVLKGVDDDAGVEVDHSQPSRSAETCASSSEAGRRDVDESGWRFSQSTTRRPESAWSGEIATRRATGTPRRAITTSSPSEAQ